MDKKLIMDENPQHRQEAFEKLLDVSLDNDYLEEAKSLIASAHIADLAGFINCTTNDQKEKIFELLDDTQTSEVLIELDASVIPKVIKIIGDEQAAKIIDSLDIDDAIFILDSLDDDENEAILPHLKGKTQKELKEGLSYPEGSAGRLMQKKFISVPKYWTIDQAIEYIQNKEEAPEVFYEIFATDPKFSPVGRVSLSTLITEPRDTVIGDIMDHEINSVKTDLDEDEVSYLFKKYGLVTLPVINKHNRLVGVLTLEDALEVIDKSAEENTMHMAGVREDDVHLNLLEVIKSRFPWLFISLLTATACSLVVNYFHATIQQVVVLSAIMPIVAGISGNAGTQTMTVTVLSLSNKEITSLNITRVVLKQILSCSFNGMVLAILGGIILALLYDSYLISFVFALAVFINFALAGLFGAFIPIFLDRCGFDPAISSPVFISTLTDILSFGIFLSLATQLLI